MRRSIEEVWEFMEDSLLKTWESNIDTSSKKSSKTYYWKLFGPFKFHISLSRVWNQIYTKSVYLIHSYLLGISYISFFYDSFSLSAALKSGFLFQSPSSMRTFSLGRRDLAQKVKPFSPTNHSYPQLCFIFPHTGIVFRNFEPLKTSHSEIENLGRHLGGPHLNTKDATRGSPIHHFWEVSYLLKTYSQELNVVCRLSSTSSKLQTSQKSFCTYISFLSFCYSSNIPQANLLAKKKKNDCCQLSGLRSPWITLHCCR